MDEILERCRLKKVAKLGRYLKNSSSLSENGVLMPEISQKWPDWFEVIGKEQRRPSLNETDGLQQQRSTLCRETVSRN